MSNQKKKMVIEFDEKDLEILQAMFGVKPEGELIQMAVKSFTALLSLNKKFQAPLAVLGQPQIPQVIESPAAKVFNPPQQVLTHTDKTSDGKIARRHDSAGNPIVENMMLTDPKSVPEEVQRELERIRKEQDARQKTLLTNRRSGKSPSQGGLVGSN